MRYARVLRNTALKMRTLHVALLFAGCSADVLEYSYYAELADAVTKIEATSYGAYEMASLMSAAESGVPSSAPAASGILGEVSIMLMVDTALGAMLAGLSSMAPALAAFGDCDPFTGYGSVSIELPFKGLYDKNFWCSRLSLE